MDNVALDVIIGLVFIYLLFSIVVTSLSEFLFNRIMEMRGTNLDAAIKSAFGASGKKSDTSADGLVKQFFDHGLVYSMYEGRRKPSEIPADVFSKAFLSVLGNYSGPADRPSTPVQFLSTLRKGNLANKDKLVATLDQLLVGAQTDWTVFERNVANWFAQIGDRSKGWYKRRISIWMLGLAFLVAYACNIDTLFIMRMLQMDKQHREVLATQAENFIAKADGKPPIAIAAPKSEMGQRAELSGRVEDRLQRAQLALGSVISANERLRTSLYKRCHPESSTQPGGENAKECQFDPYNWYGRIVDSRGQVATELNRLSKAPTALTPGSSSTSETPLKCNKGAESTTCPKSLEEIAKDLYALSSDIRLAYPDPTSKDNPELAKLVNTLYPELVETATELQRFDDQFKAPELEGEIKRICGSTDLKNFKTECKDLFRQAADGKLGFPVGWSKGLRDFQVLTYTPNNFNPELPAKLVAVIYSLEYLLGLVLTALALSMGAPFWFDILGRVVALRAAGPRRDDGLSAGTQTTKDGGLDGGTAPVSPVPVGPTANGNWFSDAVNDTERGLSPETIRQLQLRLEIAPVSGRLDQATRDAVYQWSQKRRPGSEPSWELDEAMVRELLWKTPDPLQLDPSALPVTTVLPASDGPLLDIKLGSRGAEVTRLRGLLAAGGYPVAVATGAEIFDAELYQTVKKFQTDKRLGVDGVVGPSTWLTLCNDPDKLPPAFSVPLWMARAIHEYGITEIVGSERDNPRILEYQRAIGTTPDDEIPWCSSFVNWVMKQAGVEPTGSAVASSWREWGVDTPACYGAVIVLLAQGRPVPGVGGTGAHVGFLVRETSDRYVVLAGNQGGGGGCVCVRAFPKSGWTCLAMRWTDVEAAADPLAAPADAEEDFDINLARSLVDTLTEPRLEYGSNNSTAVASLQKLLGGTLEVDGVFGDQTHKALLAFQKTKGLPPSGIADAATWHELLTVPAAVGALSAANAALTVSDIGAAIAKAGPVNLDPLAVQAVLRVESLGRGFVDGNPVVRLEGHKLWEYAEKWGVDPAPWAAERPDLVHRDADGKYNRRGAAEWARLVQARNLCRDKGTGLSLPKGIARAEQLADYTSSWGMFQIMGFNWETCGATSLDDFVARMKASEAEQLALFLVFIKNYRGAGEALAGKRWGEFARIYNGPDFRRYSYDTKLERAYTEAQLMA